MLFEVTRRGDSIMLFGGSRPTPTRWSSPAVEERVAASQEFWNETPDMGPEAQRFAVKYGIDPERPLESWLSEEDGARLNLLCEACGANPSLLAALRPWLAAQALRAAADAHDGLAPANAAEAVLRQRAVRAGVPVKSEFATPEDAFTTFAGLSPEAELQYLRFTMYEVEAGVERVTRHASALAHGDLGPIEQEAAMMREVWPDLYEQLLVRRNHEWMPRFEAISEARTRAFICVGAAHLVGEHGLLALLPGAGFAVRHDRRDDAIAGARR